MNTINYLTFINFKPFYAVPFYFSIYSSNYMKNEPIRLLMLMVDEDLSIDL